MRAFNNLLHWPEGRPPAARRFERRLPVLVGDPIPVRFQADLRIAHGKLLIGGTIGDEVHAAAFLRERRIVLDTALRQQPGELRRILAHEVFHFVWRRLGNPLRQEYEALVRAERGRGELGWSAELRKQALTATDRDRRTRRWREYLAESFCDTAAWRYAGLATHPEFTLPARAREKRAAWWLTSVESRRLSL